jgi:hypothetical protein
MLAGLHHDNAIRATAVQVTDDALAATANQVIT